MFSIHISSKYDLAVFLNYLFKFIWNYIVPFNDIRSYKWAFWGLFVTSNANLDKNPDANCATDPVLEYHQFGWLLFLALRVHAFSHSINLVTCTNGFVSILVSYNLLLLYLLVTNARMAGQFSIRYRIFRKNLQSKML